MAEPPAGLYVHFPFCLSVCPYCDFVVYAGRAARGPTSDVDRFVKALLTEIRLRARPGGLESVYLGGGTPSLMSAAQVGQLLAQVDASFGLLSDAEITLEVNPGPADRGDLAGVAAAGVNRLSIGVQSLDAAELRRLGRRHSRDDVAATVKLARRAGFASLSVDLLYDVPGQTIASWRDSLHGTLDLGPDHVSAYALALEGGALGTDHLPPSRGATQWRARAHAEQDDDRAAEMYELADATLARAGMTWYEISNWARPGHAARHNRLYWHSRPWQAVGPGAHRFDGALTWSWNEARLDAYLEALTPADASAVRLPPGASETLDAATAAAQRAILRLRTADGLVSRSARQRFAATLAWARSGGLIDDAYRLTVRGRLLSNELFERLLPEPLPSGAARGD